MSDRSLGTVLAIDRQERLVRVLTDRDAVVEVPYLDRWEPWPLATVVLEESNGKPIVCRCPIGHRRVILDDDFTRAEAADIPYGDTPWGRSGSAGSSIVTGGVGLGAAGLRWDNSGEFSEIAKQAAGVRTPTSFGSLHVHMRVWRPAAFASADLILGLYDGAGNDLVQLEISGSSGALTVGAGGALGAVFYVFDVGDPIDADIVILPTTALGGATVIGQCAGWVNGNEPVVNWLAPVTTANLYLRCHASNIGIGAAGDFRAYLDRAYMALVDPVADPSALPEEVTAAA